MAVVISGSLVLSDVLAVTGPVTADNPIVGYENLVTTANVSSTTEDVDWPVTNLANPSTNLKWVGATESPAADEYITLALNTVDDIDYIAVAKHNWGSAQITVSVEVLDDGSPETWTEVITETLLATDDPVIFRFTEQAVTSIRIRLQPGAEAPQAAVLYAGKLLVLQRRLYVGHTPLTYGRTSKVTNAKSESGNFLGRIVLNQSTRSSVPLANLTPQWFREYLWPFVLDSKENPFFFAWRPSSYPRECGFAWMTNDPIPTNALANGMMSITLEMSGIA
jgi:hypothetical protein